MEQTTLHAWLTLARAHALQSALLRRVLLSLGPVDLVSAIEQQPLPPSIIHRVTSVRSTISIDRELEQLDQHDIQLIDWEDKRYPSLLKEIHDPPPLLFYRGTLPAPDQVLIGIVG